MENLLRFHIHLLHPKLVHFPIALFLSAMGLDVLSLIFKKENLHMTPLHIYILATLVAPFVLLTGLQDAEHIHLNHPILTIHMRFALLTMWSSLLSLPILWFVNQRSRKVYRIIFLMVTLLIATFVTITGHNGGRMVFEYGVGIEE